MKPRCWSRVPTADTGSWFCRYLAEQGWPTRGMYTTPDGAPTSAIRIELVPGDALAANSIRRALQGVEVVQTSPRSTGRPTCEQAYRRYVDGVRNMVEESAQAGIKRSCNAPRWACTARSSIARQGGIADPARRLIISRPSTRARRWRSSGAASWACRSPWSGRRPSTGRASGASSSSRGPSRTPVHHVGSAKVTYHFVHVDDLSDGFVLAQEKEAAIGQAFIIADRSCHHAQPHRYGRSPRR